MAVLKGQKIDAFLKAPDPSTRSVLIYGPDRGSVSERCRTLVKAIAGSIDDPFAIERIEDAALGEDPGRLQDEARAIPMMGGPRVVWVQSAGAQLAKTIGAYLEDPAPDAWIVAEAGTLAPGAKLRQVFEKARNAVALPCYADTSRSLDDLIDDELNRHGFTIAPDARHVLHTVLGADRGLSRSEIEKLCLYAHGRDTITADDVDAVCGDVSALAMDDLVDNTFEGRIAELDADYTRLVAAGTAPQALISALLSHITRLSSVQAERLQKRSTETAMASLRPRVHFSRDRSFKKQITLWPLDALRRAASATAEVEYRSRGSDGLIEEILGRHLFSLAHAARQRR